MTTTIETLFGTETISSKPRCIRFKVIRAIWDKLEIKEPVPDYLSSKTRITSSREVFELFRFLGRETKEHFLTLHLDTKNTIICIDQVSVGSLSASIVHPREVMKSALLSSAAGMVLLHNHPSQHCEPSREDMEITTRLKECCDLFGLRLIDHIILAEDSYLSFADRGLM